MEILLDETKNSELQNLIKQGVMDYNIPYVGEWNPKYFTFYIKDEQDKVVAGLWGYYLEGQHSSIEFFWIDEKCRGQKLGTKLMKKAEDLLKSYKCPYINLYTMDFQAKSFYEKLGFTLLGTIPKWGVGYSAHFMTKSL